MFCCQWCLEAYLDRRDERGKQRVRRAQLSLKSPGSGAAGDASGRAEERGGGLVHDVGRTQGGP